MSLWRNCRRLRGRQLETKGEPGGHRERCINSRNACRPPEAIEQLAEDRAADEAADEIAGEVDTARRTTIRGCRTANEPGCRRLRQERAYADEREADQHCSEVRQQNERQTGRSEREGTPERRPCSKRCSARPAKGVVIIDGRKTK